MDRAAETTAAVDGQKVGANAVNSDAHDDEQATELLDIGLAGGVVDGRRTFGETRGHDDVGSAGNRRFVEQHICALESAGRAFEYIASVVGCDRKFSSEFNQTRDVGVDFASTDFVASRTREISLAEAGKYRTDNEQRPAQR